MKLCSVKAARFSKQLAWLLLTLGENALAGQVLWPNYNTR